MARRDYALVGVFLAIAAGVAVVLIVLLRDGESAPTRAEYIARVDAACRPYNRKLARIPAPIAVGNPDAVARSIAKALPLVEGRAAKAREIEPPPELEARVERMFKLSDNAVDELRTARRAAQAGDLQKSARALGRFLAISGEARSVASAIGLNC